MIRWDICTCNMSTNTICDPLIEIENLRDDVSFMTHRFQSAISPNVIIIICEIVITNIYNWYGVRSGQSSSHIIMIFSVENIKNITISMRRGDICINYNLQKISIKTFESKWNILSVLVEIRSSLVSHKIQLTKYESLKRYFLCY